MIFYAVLAPVIGVAIFFIGEAIRRRLKRGNEDSRKLLHAVHGLTIIAWLFLVGHQFIIAFEIFFFVAMFVIKYMAPRFPSVVGRMYKVGRDSYGEFFYPIGVIAAIVIAGSDWLIVAALLQLALADSVAAIVGKSFGKSNSYKLFGGTKSVAGTTAFAVTSAIIFLVILLPTQPHTAGLWAAIVIMPLVIAAVENVSVMGSDNLTIPLTAAVLLRLLA
ncbi:MAG: phosphatidate cytidylyltransferase [Candidatus Saccharibacteria bacterium]|nr:phosphatidate cytidylyltransferase [Candidatus Saccharibacteria bacterium]